MFIFFFKKLPFKYLYRKDFKMAKIQHFGIKYPFTSEGFENFYVDTNNSVMDEVRSQLMHVIFTPKGQRIRMPSFGSDLIKYIFDPNESVTWESVKNEVSSVVKQWVKNVNINDIQVVKNEYDESEIFVRIDYSVIDGNRVINDSIAVQI